MTIEQLLREAARSSRGEQAGPEIERCLVKEFRKQRLKRLMPLGAAAIAAAVIVGVWLIPDRQASVVSVPVEEVSPQIAEPMEAVLPLSQPQQQVVKRVPARLKPPQATSREVRTAFYALDAGVLAEPGGTFVIRIKVPRAAMASFGLPVNQDLADQRVDADLLIGEDGTARAIRFVRTIQ